MAMEITPGNEHELLQQLTPEPDLSDLERSVGQTGALSSNTKVDPVYPEATRPVSPASIPPINALPLGERVEIIENDENERSAVPKDTGVVVSRH